MAGAFVEYALRETSGARYLEGTPKQPLIRRPEDVIAVLEACFAGGARRLLLYPENLSLRFFDLKSGEAGEILQKLRNYHIQLAIVSTPTLQLSQRFAELLADEQRGPYFRLFEERSAAEAWLSSDQSSGW
jgi:hypothetical protein